MIDTEYGQWDAGKRQLHVSPFEFNWYQTAAVDEILGDTRLHDRKVRMVETLGRGELALVIHWNWKSVPHVGSKP